MFGLKSEGNRQLVWGGEARLEERIILKYISKKLCDLHQNTQTEVQ
jgi:hypothetical protein